MSIRIGIKLTSLSTWDSSTPKGINDDDWVSTGHTSWYDGVEYAEFGNGQGSLLDWDLPDSLPTELLGDGNDGTAEEKYERQERLRYRRYSNRAGDRG